MEFKIILNTTLSLVFLFFMLITPSASHLQSSNDLGGADDDHKVSLHTLLPRKLKLSEAAAPVKGYEDKELVPQHKQNHGLSDEKEGHGHVLASSRGTRQEEWLKRSEKENSEFFTMDYSHVRRRRPIHNKSLPVVAP